MEENDVMSNLANLVASDEEPNNNCIAIAKAQAQTTRAVARTPKSKGQSGASSSLADTAVTEQDAGVLSLYMERHDNGGRSAVGGRGSSPDDEDVVVDE